MFENRRRQFGEFFRIIWMKRWALTVLIIFGVGFLLLAWWQDPASVTPAVLFLGLATQIVGFILTFVIIERGIERIKKLDAFNIVHHSRLNFRTFLGQVSDARNCVRILDSYTYLVHDTGGGNRYWQETQVALQKAIDRKSTEIQILLCNPKKSGLRERADQIVNSKFANSERTTEELLRNCHVDVVRLDGFIKGLLAGNPAIKISVRLIDILPSITLHRADNVCYWSFYPLNRIASEDDNLETESDSRLGLFLNDRFDDLWTNQSITVSLEDYLKDHCGDVLDK